MTYKKTNKFQALGSIIVISVMVFGISNVYAEESSQYKMIGDVLPVLTFTFRAGIETVEFSMFSQDKVISTTESTDDDAFTKKSVYPTFELRGIVGDYPMLYKSVGDNKQFRGVTGTIKNSL